jgi:hypothetical protein
MTIMNLVTPIAGGKRELLFSKPATVQLLVECLAFLTGLAPFAIHPQKNGNLSFEKYLII